MVVVVNLYDMSTFIDPANKLLADIVSDYPNAIIADWYSAVSAQPQMLQSDQTHPNMDGMHLFAETVRGHSRTFGSDLGTRWHLRGRLVAANHTILISVNNQLQTIRC